jgi:DNA ligase (NAD+)
MSSMHLSLIQQLSPYENKKMLSQLLQNKSIWNGEETDIRTVISHLKTLYHNEGTSPWSDMTYDMVCEILKEEYGWDVESGKSVGSTIIHGEEVALPYYMGSMNKYKTEKEIINWMKKYKGPYMVSAKLDGISALFMEGERLYTRGNGTMGRDIRHLIPHLSMYDKGKRGPHEFPGKGTSIRGELIMRKSVFINKYESEYANARNLVCGMVNRNFKDSGDKTISIFQDIEFVAYDIYGVSWSIEEKFNWLENHGYNLVSHCGLVVNKKLHSVNCDHILKDWKSVDFDYEIDGIIVSNHEIHVHETGKNPVHAFAYKNNTLCVEMTQGIVKQVLWNISKDNYVKPKIQLIEPISCDQSKVEYVTGFNARFIVDNCIEPGTVLKVGLSGSVIPHIFEVLSTNSVKQSESYYLNTIKEITSHYTWSKNKIDIICLDKGNPQHCIKQNMMFFRTMGMKCNLQEKTLVHLYEGLEILELKDILSLSLEDWVKVENMGKKKASGILSCMYDTLNWKQVCGRQETNYYDYYLRLAVGLQTFSRGFAIKKMRLFTDYLLHLPCEVFDWKQVCIPQYIEDRKKGLLEKVYVEKPKQITVDTMGLFLEGLSSFVDYIDELHDANTMSFTFVSSKELFEKVGNEFERGMEKNKGDHPTYVFAFSGVRHKELEQALMIDGHKIVDTISKNTTMLIVKDTDKVSSKMKKAKECEVPIYTVSEFILFYKEFKDMTP